MPRFRPTYSPRCMNLPMDFFERTQVGKIAYDINQIFRIRNFLVGQLFGTILDSTTLLFFIPVMFFFSPMMTAVVVGLAALIVVWLIAWLPAYRRKIERGRGGGIGKGRVSGADSVRRSHGQVAGARCAPATHVGCARRARDQAAFRRRHDGQSDASRRAAAGATWRSTARSRSASTLH